MQTGLDCVLVKSASLERPEERELDEKRAALDKIEIYLEERELELSTVQAKLRRFEARVLKTVGSLYAQIDNIEAEVAEARAKDDHADQRAQEEVSAAHERPRELARQLGSLEALEEPEPFEPSQERTLFKNSVQALLPTEFALSVIVPVHNERYLVGSLLGQLVDLTIPFVSQLEVLVVDDGSTDGSSEIIRRIADAHPDRIRHLHKPRREGKGSAVRSGIGEATGDLIVIQDADLEYDPGDLQKLVRPFAVDGADVVYGSRFAASDRRRVLYYRHTLGNRLLTLVSNIFTDLNLTDVETCYKMFRGPLLKSIPIRSNDFAMEIELTSKIAKRNCNVFEVPISYRGRTYAEGKKIGWKDGVKAMVTAGWFFLVDDLYQEDEYGGQILHSLERAQRFNGWMADAIRPFVGDRVLEIGAGIGNMTQQLVPRDAYVASDVNSSYLSYLRNAAAGKPYLTVTLIDLENPASFTDHTQRFDTVVCLNVLEHVRDPMSALRSMFEALAPGGRLVLYVPRGQNLYSPLDEALGHRCRYEILMLKNELEGTGFEVERMDFFNRISVFGWWWNGKIRRKRTFSRWQLKVFDTLVPIFRRVDNWLPWKGLGIIAVARRPAMPPSEE